MHRPMTRPLGAQISHMLRARGVDTIFGIPGVHNIEMYRGIEEAGITHVLARHEGGAAFMADGYARATGKPGIVYVITGPGLTNAMTGIGQAYSDSVPMLVISSCLDDTAATRGQLHQMRDQRAAAATVTAWAEEPRSPQATYQLIDRALAELAVGRARPRAIQVPIALLGAPAPQPPERAPGDDPASGGQQMPPGLATICDDLRRARKPLFIFGGGLVARGADTSTPRREELVRDLLRRSGAAAFTTYAGGGLVAADDPLGFGSFLGRSGSEQIIAGADLVIAIGTELSECDLWRDQLGHSGRLVRVDIDPEVLADRHRAGTTIQSDAMNFVRELLAILPAGTATPKWDAAAIAATRAGFRARVAADRPGIVPICDALRGCLPADTMIFSDMTQFAYVAKEVWDLAAPGLWHHPSGFGTLGYALPAAIGGKVGRPDSPVVAIAGDYGFQYTMQELGTAAELGLSLPILLWDNGRLKEIEDGMVQAQIAPNAVVARNPDFLKLAAAYGIAGVEPATLADLTREVQAALQRTGPTLIRMTPALTG